MKILVTGGAGFIGSHIVDALIEGGHEVAVVDDLSTGRLENLNPRAAFYKTDIRDKSLSSVFDKERPDVVCHHAAQISVRNSVADPCNDADINVVGSINVLERCREYGVKKVLFASSGGAVYGEQEVYPAPESHPTNPLSPYGAAKRAVEIYLNYYREIYGLPYVALRYSNVYGPRQDPHGEAGVVAIFAGTMLKGETPTVNGDGAQTRDYVYVKDVVRANLAALAGGFVGCCNIGTGIETDVNAIYSHIREAAGYGGGKDHGPAKTGEQLRSVLDCGFAARALGWRPETALPEGISKTVDYFRAKLAGVKG